MKTSPLTGIPRIEPLEARIAPANITVVITDSDGDLVSVHISGPGDFTEADVTGAIMVASGTFSKLDLTNAKFKGANIDISAKPDVTKTVQGDGFIHVGQIDATGNDLGTVKVKGDLISINAGDADTATPAIKELNVQSMGKSEIPGTPKKSDIKGGVGKIKIAGDLKGSFIQVDGVATPENGTIGSVSIGGGTYGTSADGSGGVFASGNIGTVTVGAGLHGGSGGLTGSIQTAGSIKKVEIDGGMTGGSGDDSAQLKAGKDIGSVTVKGDLQSHTAGESGGSIKAGGNIGTVNVTGNVTGNAAGAGTITAGGKIKSVTIGKDLTGNADEAGKVSAGGELGTVSIGGDVLGNVGTNAGQISGSSIKTGVTIGGNLVGGPGDNSGSVKSNGNAGKVTVKGKVTGGGGKNSGSISMAGDGKGVFIGWSLLGGGALNAGTVNCGGNLASCVIGDDLAGGAASHTGEVLCTGTLTSCIIGSNLVGSNNASSVNLAEEGCVHAGEIGTCIVMGDCQAGARTGSGTSTACGAIVSDTSIGTCMIEGSCRGDATNPFVISGVSGMVKDFVFKKIIIAASAEFTRILAGFDAQGALTNCDTQIGPISIGGDFSQSDISSGISPGADGFFGTLDDSTLPAATKVTNNPGLFSTIASVTVKGQFLGNTFDGGKANGIVAGQIGKITNGARTFMLTPGPFNDIVRLSNTAGSAGVGDFAAREDIGS